MKSNSQKQYDYWRKSAMKNAWFAPKGEPQMLGVSFVYGQLWCFQEKNLEVTCLGVVSISDRMDAIMAAHYIHTYSKKSYRDGLFALYRVVEAVGAKRLHELNSGPLRAI